LGSYNIDKSKITVSGISAGGAMAAQMHVAYSATIKGAGIVTGRTFKCYF
jgi:poly(3-hydroxybutyrate) depolymerase